MMRSIKPLLTLATFFAPSVLGRAPAVSVETSKGIVSTTESSEVKQCAVIPESDSGSFLPLQTTSHVITEEFLKKFSVGDAPTKHDWIPEVMKIRNSDPEIAHYIDVVFNYLPGFTISMSNVTQHLDNAHSDTSYSPSMRSIKLPIKGLTADKIRHEFRHAYFHAIQIARAGFNTYSTNTYLENITKKEVVVGYLDAGDKRVNDLEILLRLESAKGKVSESDREELERLRHSVSKIFAENYAMRLVTFEDVSSKTLKTFQDSIGKTLVFPGTSLAKFGAVIVRSFEKVSGHDDLVTVSFQVKDPLRLLVYYVELLSVISEHYDVGDHLFERDAFLFEVVPVTLIKEYYPEYFAHVTKLFEETVFPEQFQLLSVDSNSFVYSFDLYHRELLAQLTQDNFQAKEVDLLLKIIEVNIRKKSLLKQCENAASIIVKQGAPPKKVDAKLYLGDLAFLRRDYKTVVSSYENAAKRYANLSHQKLPFSESRMLNYATSLYEIKKFKDAIKICKMALSYKNWRAHKGSFLTLQMLAEKREPAESDYIKSSFLKAF